MHLFELDEILKRVYLAACRAEDSLQRQGDELERAPATDTSTNYLEKQRGFALEAVGYIKMELQKVLGPM